MHSSFLTLVYPGCKLLTVCYNKVMDLWNRFDWIHGIIFCLFVLTLPWLCSNSSTERIGVNVGSSAMTGLRLHLTRSGGGGQSGPSVAHTEREAGYERLGSGLW